MELLVFSLFAILLFLFPVSVYLAILAGLNRREHPTMIPGLWDCVSLLLGLSGFLLVAGPALLYVIYRRSLPGLLAAEGEVSFLDFLVMGWNRLGLAGYYLLVTALVCLVLWIRSKATVIYNIPPEKFEQVLSEVFMQREIPWSRWGRRVRFRSQSEPPISKQRTESSETNITTAEVAQRSFPAVEERVTTPIQSCQIVVDSFPLFWNVTVWWHSVSDEMRVELERDLQLRLQTVRSGENSAAGWLLAAAGTLFGIIVVAVIGLVLFVAFPQG